jgi:hypothetical protein
MGRLHAIASFMIFRDPSHFEVEINTSEAQRFNEMSSCFTLYTTLNSAFGISAFRKDFLASSKFFS